MIFYPDTVLFDCGDHLDRRWCLVVPSQGNEFLIYEDDWFRMGVDISRVKPMKFIYALQLCRLHNEADSSLFPRAAICDYEMAVLMAYEGERFDPASATQRGEGGRSGKGLKLEKSTSPLMISGIGTRVASSRGI